MHTDAVLLTLRLVLAAVFSVAGLAKLADRPGSRQALRDFGVPDRFVSPVTTLLPLLELLVAAALLPASTAVAGAAGGLLLLVVFVAAIANSLAHGRRPNCHCFGQLHSSRVSWRVLARNGLLAVVAAAVVMLGWTAPGPSLVAWLGDLRAIELAGVVGGAAGLLLLAAQVALLIRVSHQTERLLRQLATPAVVASPAAAAPPDAPRPQASPAGLPVGMAAPDFSLPGTDGRRISLEALLAGGKPVLLVFSDDHCQPCRLLMPRIAEWQRQHAAVLQIAVLSSGNSASSLADGHGVTPVLWQKDHEVARRYQAPGTPAAVLVNPDGTIATPPIAGDVEIGRLVADAARRAVPGSPGIASSQDSIASRTSSGPVVAPDFTLQDLEGRAVTLADYRGKPTVLLFWNPTCVFCTHVLPQVREWDARPAGARHQLLVVSDGSIEDNRAMGLTSTIVRDPDFEVGKRYGLGGTPAVALVDEDGRLAGTPLSGGPGVLATLEFASSSTQTADLVPRKRDGVEDELLEDGSMILYSSSRARVLTLNGTAALVWECCDGAHTIADIVREVREVFPAAPDAGRDVRDFLMLLLQEGMVSLADRADSLAVSQASA